MSSLPVLSEDLSVVGLLQVKEEQMPVATMTVHWQQYHTNQDSLVPIHKLVRQLESRVIMCVVLDSGPELALPGCGASLKGVKVQLILLCKTGICLITTEERQVRLAAKQSIGKVSSQGTFIEQGMGGGGVRVPYEAGGQGLPCTGQSAQHKETRATEMQQAASAGLNS
ncbi:hypothetical protein QYF61_005073 [Mycteria americana]|uniref:Uncharacterized protein n=1 Tax=Mycteria americana TaxID=33587 RepID=A0AAN7N7F5_MYCAM|nr:hypothetical protein QYF61_005073 [Mycteria americana]